MRNRQWFFLLAAVAVLAAALLFNGLRMQGRQAHSGPPMAEILAPRATVSVIRGAVASHTAGLWELPNSSLSQRGEIWYVTEDDTLASLEVEPVFSQGEWIYVQPPANLTQCVVRVVVHPLHGYLGGMAVNPVSEDEHA